MEFKEVLKELNHQIELNKNLNKNIELLRKKLSNLNNEIDLLKEENKSLKDGIEGVYNNMIALDIIRHHETEEIDVI